MAKPNEALPTIPMRALLGFMVAAISMLTFHQAMWEALHVMKIPRMTMPPPFPLNPVPPLGLPRIANLCVWGGMFGAAFAVAIPKFTFPLWICGLGMGLFVGFTDMMLFPQYTGSPVGYEWTMQNWLKTMLLDGAFGIGVGILTPFFVHGVGGWTKFRQD